MKIATQVLEALGTASIQLKSNKEVLCMHAKSLVIAVRNVRTVMYIGSTMLIEMIGDKGGNLF